jgi:hypothetical protein
MASTYLTPTAVTRAIAVELHEQGKFLRRINRQYDAQYAADGQRKGGGSIKIRMPNEYSVRTGTVMNVQDTAEVSETLTIGTMKGVDLSFTDTDLALSIEDFTKRFITPAVKVLVSNIEADIITGCANKVANMVDNDGNAISFLNVMNAKRKLIENLAPDDQDDLSLFLAPKHVPTYIDAVKGLYTPGSLLGEQYRTGMMGLVAGVGWVDSSTHLTDLTTGTNSKGDTTYDTDIAAGEDNGSVGATGINIDTGSGTFKVGEVFEIESVNAVHPETKADLGYRKQFVVTEDAAGGANTLLKFSVGIGGHTGIDATTARQNVSAAAVDGKIIYKVGAGNAETLNRSLYFHRDAFAVSFADLENPKKYGAWGDTQVVDNISVRLWRQGDITNGTFPCRLDVLYGYKAIRPQLACRIHADG